ncbi:MAG: deoxyribonuclease IV [Planctomycetota bacterium]
MFGSHLSVAGGMHNAITEAVRLKLDCVQVFTKNQQQWKVKPLADEAVKSWNDALRDAGWWTDDPLGTPRRLVSHASYLINLASPDDELWDKSIGLMQVEIERCDSLGIPLLVHHPGAYTTGTEKGGLARIAKAYTKLFKRTKGARVVSLLENTVGSGSNLGRTFDQLGELRRRIIDTTGEPDRVGFCIDTCHAHAGGYDLSHRTAADEALDALDEHCGLGHVHALHLNDSLKDVGSRKDRHAHIGEGTICRRQGRETGGKVPIGRSGFAAVVNQPAWAGVPKIMETPKGQDDRGRDFDTLNVRRLRRLLEDNDRS